MPIILTAEDQEARDTKEASRKARQVDAGEADPHLINERDAEITAASRRADEIIVRDKKDPYAYFEQFTNELQTMGDEISSMLIEFKLDLPSIKEVLRYAEASAKRDLKQLTTAKAA